MAFDREAAKKAGYTDSEIDEYLKSQRKPMADTGATYEPFGIKGNPILENVLQGATLGYSDELQSGAKSLFDKLRGDPRSIKDIYTENKQTLMRPVEQYQKENPMMSLGQNVIGGLATGGLMGSALKSKVPAGVAEYAKLHPMLTASGAGATAGVVAGGGFAPTMADVPEYASSGALTGAALPPLIAGGGKVLDTVVGGPMRAAGRAITGALDDPSLRAAKMVEKELKRDAVSMDDILTRRRELGPDALLADVGGKNLQGLAQTVASQKGRGAQMAEDVLQSRMEASPERLVSGMRGIFKKDKSAYNFMKGKIAERKSQSAPLYKLSNDDMVKPGMMDDFMAGLQNKIDDYEGTSIGKSLASVKNSLTLSTDGKKIPKLQISKLHAAKQDLDQKIANSYKDYKATPLTTELMSVKRQLLGFMDEASPNYAKARQIYSDDSSVLEATRLGTRILKMNTEEMKDKISTMSKADKEGFITGAMQSLSDTFKGVKEGANAARRVATPLIKERLRNAFDDEATYNQFIKSLDAEDVFAQTRNNVLRGSQTQSRLAMADASAMDAGVDIAQGRFLSAALDGIRNFFGSQRQIPEPVRDELAELLFKDVAAGHSKVSADLVKRMKRHDVSERMLNKMLDTIRMGVPVASGEVGAILEQ